MTKGKEKEAKKPLKPIKYNENPKERAARELTPEMVARGLRKWLMDDKKK